jgi:hypothetical protein
MPFESKEHAKQGVVDILNTVEQLVWSEIQDSFEEDEISFGDSNLDITAAALDKIADLFGIKGESSIAEDQQQHIANLQKHEEYDKYRK